MSSFINNAKTFNSVEESFKDFFFKSGTNDHPFRPFGLNKWENNEAQNRERITELFNNVREVQSLSYHFQYETPDGYNVHKLKAEIDEQVKLTKLKTKIKKLKGAALFKNLCCISYQIEPEGIDLDFAEAFYPDTNIEEAVKFMETAESQVAKSVVYDSAAWERAEWGIESD